MLSRRAPVVWVVVCLMCLLLPSCLARRRVISHAGGKGPKTLLSATRASLVEHIRKQFEAVRDFQSTVDLVPALGSPEKSRITEYKDVRGYILFRKPADIRIIGLYPVVRNKAFDMVSNGTDFKLFVPAKNRFLVGTNVVETPSKNKLENLRPGHFLEALLVRPVDGAETVLLENFTDEDNALYILHMVKRGSNGFLELVRTVWFSRLDLKLMRQIIYDSDGNILTDARYNQWSEFDGVAFPRCIEINRPRDEYAAVITVLKMEINRGLADEKFVLEQPEGSTLRVVGAPAEQKAK